MSTNVETGVTSDWTRFIDTASKLGALSFVAVYAIGYLVTSIHLAASGVGFANPLKPRTAAAGVLFCLLFGWPMLVSEQFIKRQLVLVPSLPETSFTHLYRATRFYGVCLGSAFLLFPLFAFSSLGLRRTAVLAGLIIIEAGFAGAVRTWESLEIRVVKHPRFLAWLYFFLLLAFSTIPFSTLREEFTWAHVPLWLFGCGVFVQSTRHVAKQKLSGAVPYLVLQALLPVLVFGTWIYPHVKSEWGGGQPVDIVAHFTKDSSVFASQKVSMRLLDEADAGFYVLLQNQKRVVFLPRGSVASIAYSTDQSSVP